MIVSLAEKMVEDKREWVESLDYIYKAYGEDGVREILTTLHNYVLNLHVPLAETTLNTPYINTISPAEQRQYPGDLGLEKRIENIIRWNAMAMVLQAQDEGTGVGGHIATYASAAAMLEVGFNHFFRAATSGFDGDIVMPQPHAAPGIYARAFLEGRLTEQRLHNFRRELGEGGGLSSYPHPRSMPDFWQMPNASMGLSTPAAIYQARFAKYLENRGHKPSTGSKIWCFIGDGEADEPEVLGTINIAAREKLDNLILVINCNLQRLDGPVRGNGKIIQELERTFRGADWNVIKVIWGSGWDTLLAQDVHGVLRKRMDECLDGDYQRYSILPGDLQRKHWVEGNPELERMMSTLTDDEVKTIQRGGQDPRKIYAAFERAIKASNRPTVILIKTVKGDNMGASVQGRNTSHQKKSLKPEERIQLARDYGIPISEEAATRAEFYKPPEDSEEIQYLKRHRDALGGYLPVRKVHCAPIDPPALDLFADTLKGSGKREISTTMVMVRLLTKLLKDKQLGSFVVPIVPDEARTFGMDGLFRVAGIYSSEGQKYTPMDADSLLPYREAKDGQILQEGICETGAMASFMAAGSAYAVHGLPMIPFYFFYSMFGFQRVGDMIWACGDAMCRGFLVGGTAGRTTLNGEGLQHADGHSQVLANTVPNLWSYDPSFGYELATIVREGIRRMYTEQEDVFYYLTVYNENYLQPAMPVGVEEGILKGIYRFKAADPSLTKSDHATKVHLLGSGSIMQQVLDAQDELCDRGITADVWSVTSYNLLYRDATECEAWNCEHPDEEAQLPYLMQAFGDTQGTFIAVSDFMKVLPASIAQWVPGKLICLGTDGYGLSESRESLRDHFGISTGKIVQVVMQEVG